MKNQKMGLNQVQVKKEESLIIQDNKEKKNTLSMLYSEK